MSRRLAILGSLLALGLLFLSCEDDEETIPVLTVGTTLWKAGGGAATVQVAATSTWKFEVEYSGGQTGWIHFDPVSGSGFGSSTMTVDANSGDSPRQATVFLRSPHYFAKAEISQSGGVMAGPQWLEMPAVNDADGFGFFTHNMSGGLYVDSEKSGVRNWSFLWDYENHLSHWVAYPLNKGLIGKGGRTDIWGYDPLIPADQQPNITVTYGGGWSRGHQIPSADRLDREANISTFYATNMTPQNYDFNGEIWADLEQQVRSYSSKCDTLYVVTGCDIRGYTMSSRPRRILQGSPAEERQRLFRRRLLSAPRSLDRRRQFHGLHHVHRRTGAEDRSGLFRQPFRSSGHLQCRRHRVGGSTSDRQKLVI